MDGLFFKLVLTDVTFGWLEAVALWIDAVAEVKKLNFNYYGIIYYFLVLMLSGVHLVLRPTPPVLGLGAEPANSY